jgi:transcriptional regulator with XRE-family HTH domain
MKEFNMRLVGERIKELRNGASMSQACLAEKIGVHQNTLSQYENGTSKMSIEVLFSLAIALDTTTDYLLGLNDEG